MLISGISLLHHKDEDVWLDIRCVSLGLLDVCFTVSELLLAERLRLD